MLAISAYCTLYEIDKCLEQKPNVYQLRTLRILITCSNLANVKRFVTL